MAERSHGLDVGRHFCASARRASSLADLIERVREIVPHVALSSDFISGFCGESEADHELTLDLLERVRFDKAFMFAYSLREKTHAHRRLDDDVPEPVKQRRLREVIDTFTRHAKAANEAEVGKTHHVLLEGVAKKEGPNGEVEWMGRTDTNKRVVLRRAPVAASPTPADHAAPHVDLAPGEYVAVRVSEALSANTLRAEPLARCSIAQFVATDERQWRMVAGAE
jgi:tRNA A37 methylthiotransferase MiaB